MKKRTAAWIQTVIGPEHVALRWTILLAGGMLRNKSWNIERSDVYRLSSPKRVKVRLLKFQNAKAKYPWPFCKWSATKQRASTALIFFFFFKPTSYSKSRLSCSLRTWFQWFLCGSFHDFVFSSPCNLTHPQILKAARWSWMPARPWAPSAAHLLTSASTRTSSPQVSDPLVLTVWWINLYHLSRWNDGLKKNKNPCMMVIVLGYRAGPEPQKQISSFGLFLKNKSWEGPKARTQKVFPPKLSSEKQEQGN